nr:hypothetical protein [Pirellulaceae bacterium]
MELFTITCTTCRQRLKVCDASTIGEIQICPKCGSMVLVEPPAGWTEPPGTEPPLPSLGSAPASKHLLPEDARPAHSPSVSPPPAGRIPAEPSVTFADAPVGDGDARVAAAAAPPLAESPAAPPLDGEPIAAEPILPTEDWTSQAARQRQQWLMLGGAAVVGVALALGLVGFFASRAANQARDAAAPARVAPEAAVAGVSGPPQEAISKPRASMGEPGSATAAVPNQPSADVVVTPAADAPKGPLTDIAPSPQPVPTESLTPGESSTAGPKPEAMPAASPPSKERSAAPETTAAAKPKEANLDPGALSETLKAFAPFIDPNVDPAPPEPMNAADQGVPQLDPQTVTDQRPSIPRPEPRSVDVPARLRDKIAEAEFADVPLKNFLRFVMNFSTIPISLDPDALALVRVTPRTKINVRKADATIDHLLAAALGPLQLAHLAVDQQLIVTRPPQADGGLRKHAHAVSDLVGNNPQSL